MTFDASLLLRGKVGGVDMQCDSPSESARSRKVRRLVPVSLSSTLPHRKKIKVGSHGSSPPLLVDGGDGSVALPSTNPRKRMEEVCVDGYDASANLSMEESETSMSFGSFRGDDEVVDGEEEDVDDEMDDESSFSELSYDGVAFDFGYGRRRLAAGLSPVGSHHRHRIIVIEIPYNVRQEMDRRALEGELEHCRRADEQRIPEALQEVFLRSQRGEPVDHPPPSGLAFKVFSWPHARAPTTAESQPSPSKGAPVAAGDVHTCAPTQPRRRGSLSAASTIKDDEDEDDDDDGLKAEKAPLVLDRWRPLVRKYYDPGHHHHRHRAHDHRPRIPLELQDVFVKAQQGHDVDAPPIRGIGFKIFDGRGGPGPTAPPNRWGPYHHSSHYHCRQGAHEATIATSVRHE
jgi:hypothetical protein